MHNIAVVIPSLKRPEGLLRAVESVLSTAPGVKVVCVIEDDDAATARILPTLEAVSMVVTATGTAPEKWNAGAAAAEGADYFVIGADDIVFQPGWREACLTEMAKLDGWGVVGMNEGEGSLFGELATHFMVSRSYAVERLGGTIMIPVYPHHFTDTEVTGRAVRDGAIRWAEGAKIKHFHPYYGTAPTDEIYQRGQESYEQGLALYQARQKAGWPDDFPPAFSGDVRERPPGWGRVAIGLRNMRTWPSEFGRHWSVFIMRGLRPGDSLLDTNIGHMKSHHTAANDLAESFLEGPCDSLLLVDDDMIIPHSALHLMRDNKNNWDYDVVQGFATHKQYPPHAVALVLDGNGPNFNALAHFPESDVTPVDAVGMAFTLIGRHVLEEMDGEYGSSGRWFDFGGSSEMEDMAFSRRCRAAGFRMGVDTSAKIGHLGEHTYGWAEHQQYVKLLETNNG